MSDHKVLTLNGSAQALLEGFGAGEPPGGANDLQCGFISVQAGTANANPFFIGGPEVSDSDYGVRIPAPTDGEPVAPFVISGGPSVGVRLSRCHVFGTDGEKIHILYDWF